nr:hypothetical protein [Nitrosomonas nitrosa]
MLAEAPATTFGAAVPVRSLAISVAAKQCSIVRQQRHQLQLSGQRVCALAIQLTRRGLFWLRQLSASAAGTRLLGD